MRPLTWILFSAIGMAAVGCTSPAEYFQNGFKVGPNYKKPPAPVADHWIDAEDKRLRSDSPENVDWWNSLNDPVLDSLVRRAANENLTLKEAGQRVLEFRARRAIAVGNLFPQTQQAGGGFTQTGLSYNLSNQPAPQNFFNVWDAGFNLSWELDFWGRFRRAIESADATLNASIEQYDDVMVTLIGDVASTYVQIRTLQTRIKLAKDNVVIQKENFAIADALFKGGKTSRIDVDQSQTNLSQVEASIPQFEIQLRQAQNNLCVLLGIPAQDLTPLLGTNSIPRAAPDLVVGIPAELLRRRPDVRRAERLVAAQSAQIGIAEAEFYPQFFINGNLGWAANDFNDLLEARSLAAQWGPSFQWNILNYGRILNNVRLQDARFQQLIANYQNTVLNANAEVENGIVQYLKGHLVVRNLAKSVEAAEDGVKLASVQYREGKIPFVVLSTLQTNLVNQQDQLAQAYGNMVLGLVQTYRALGGGWQIRLQDIVVPEVPAPNIVPGIKLDIDPVGVPPVRPNAVPVNLPNPNPQAGLGAPVAEFVLTVNQQPAGMPVTIERR